MKNSSSSYPVLSVRLFKLDLQAGKTNTRRQVTMVPKIVTLGLAFSGLLF